ncbi:MAG TPA: endonuclease/exonuclease/phosphatase family protein [Pyrinomonadaceae bacterium]|nr:endonuclease/exonuclease/phosphatase family protein [Pyrinomonadaceae bacterium]
MQPFDGPLNGASGRQIAFDERRLRYLECLAKRAFLKSKPFERWIESERRRAPEPKPGSTTGEVISPLEAGHATLCDAIHDLGLAKLDPGLDLVSDALDKLPDTQRDAIQREWLLNDSRETALARSLLVRAQPERQDELFGWERTGLNSDVYWARLIPAIHMEYLLETADFGANEVLRIMYLLDDTPEHLLNAAVLWRDPDNLQRDVNFPAGGAAALHTSFTNFKYWFDDPFRCDEFTGRAKEVRGNKAINGHEEMKPGMDMTYWSENHRILFATAEYLAGQFWPNEMFISQRKNRKEGLTGAPRPGDMTGAGHMNHARTRVLRWLNERLRLGFAEWNAPGYYVEDILPLLNLVDFAIDKEIKIRAAMVMDLLVFDLAVHSQSGAFAGSAGRAYFENKNCVWEQSVRDSSEILFGQSRHFTQSSNAAAFLATSPSYRPPDALIALAKSGPQQFTTRSRVSINFDEAHEYGVGTSTAEDMEFWWSRAAYATKQTILASRRVATESGLLDTEPFKKILPLIKKVADAIDTAEDVGAGIIGGLAGAAAGFAVGGVAGAVIGGTAGAFAGASVPNFTEVDAADKFSVLTEGSVLSRANIYSHCSGGATLASVQDFRRGQISLQSLPCVATVSNGAMVWTSYPSAGSRVSIGLPFGLKDIDEEIFPPDSHDGPNWWTGSVVQPRVVQKRGAAITAYKAKSIQKILFGERTHAWFPRNQFDETRGPASARCNHDSARWFFGRSGDSYVALFCALETNWTDNGPWKDKEIRVDGHTNVFITQIGSVGEFGSFEGFMAKVSQARVHIIGLHSDQPLICSYDMPFGESLILSYDAGPHYGGAPLQDDGYPRHRSPFARIEWQQDRYAIRYDNRSLVHDVVHGIRTIGGALTELNHDAPLTFHAQNMALLPGPLYKGIDSDAALGKLISVLRERQPDVVGLSEMWVPADRARITSELSDLYPHTFDGPHEDSLDLLVTDTELMGGGLLLLSRHPILVSAQTVYRQCSGDDCLANKGVLHARIQRTGHPCAVDVFLTHTQAPHPTIGGTTAGARAAVKAQIRHLAAFIRASRDVVGPAILFGDFNVDFFAHHDLYNYLVSTLGGPVDLVPTVDIAGRAHPTGTSESDDGVISSFHSDHPPRSVEDPSRFGLTVERLDYLFSFPGLLYLQHNAAAAVVIEQWTSGRDMSDHYGIVTSIDTIVETFPSERDLSFVLIRLRHFQCLTTTSGPGDDEVIFTLTATTSRGERATLSTPEVEDVSAGTRHEFDLAALRLSDPGDELSLTIEGRELDNLSADDSLGRTRLEFDRYELLALADRGTMSLAFPLLRGDGSEYVVEVDLQFG